jgi:ADP-heptose:LPS heptosyltransferase
VLVRIHGNRLGDLLLLTPLVAALRDQLHAAVTLMQGPEKPEPWLAGHPLFADTWWDDRGERDAVWWGTARLQREVRDRRFDAALMVSGGWRYVWSFWRAGIPIRVGSTVSRFRGALMTHNLSQNRDFPDRHEVEYNFDLGRPLGLTGEPGPLVYPIPAEDAATADRLLSAAGVGRADRLVVLNPTFGGSSRPWPAERFIRVGRAIAAHAGARIILTGTAPDRPANDAIARVLGPASLDLTGRTTVSVLGAILRRSALHLSIDTGTSHLAAAMGTPCVTIFPYYLHWDRRRRWHPWRTPVRLVGPGARCDVCRPGHCVQTQATCVDSVSTDAVLDAVFNLLDASFAKGAAA